MIALTCNCCSKLYHVKPSRKLKSKYCSHSCRAKKTIAGHNKQLIFNNCKCCGVSYKTIKSENGRTVYCSRKCQNKCQTCFAKLMRTNIGEKNPQYKNGICAYRRIAREHYPEICNRCHSLKNLIVHHIDEDRTNNQVENLEIICRRCHQIEHRCWENLPTF